MTSVFDYDKITFKMIMNQLIFIEKLDFPHSHIIHNDDDARRNKITILQAIMIIVKLLAFKKCNVNELLEIIFSLSSVLTLIS